MKIKKLQSYFKQLEGVSMLSPDEETKVGVLLVDVESDAVVATGYNGFCRGSNDDKLPKTRPAKYPYMIHAETNLICNCARHGISTNRRVLVSNLSPCTACVRVLHQAGINTVYFQKLYRDMKKSKSMGDLTLIIDPYGEFYRLTIFAGS